VISVDDDILRRNVVFGLEHRIYDNAIEALKEEMLSAMGHGMGMLGGLVPTYLIFCAYSAAAGGKFLETRGLLRIPSCSNWYDMME
jgi:hypothetical protein